MGRRLQQKQKLSPWHKHTQVHMYMYVCVCTYIWYYGNHVISFHCNAIEFFALRCAGINMITIHRHSHGEFASEMQFLINLSSLFAVVATAADAADAVVCQDC